MKISHIYKLFIDFPNYKKMFLFWMIGPIVLFIVFLLVQEKHKKDRKIIRKFNVQVIGIVEGIRTVRGASTIELSLLSKNLKPNFYKEVKVDGKTINTNLIYIGESHAYIKNVNSIVQLKDCVIVDKEILKIYRKGKLIEEDFF